MNLLDDGTLYVSTKKAKNIKKVLVTDNKGEYAKLFYEKKNCMPDNVLNEILVYVKSMHDKGLGKKKSLEFIEKYIKGQLKED